MELIPSIFHQHLQPRILYRVKTTTAKSGNRFTHHGATDGRVVAVHRFPPQGWVIETDFRAYLWSGGQLVDLLDTEPLSVRTFEGSKRFRQLIAVTVEEGVQLISAIRRL